MRPAKRRRVAQEQEEGRGPQIVDFEVKKRPATRGEAAPTGGADTEGEDNGFSREDAVWSTDAANFFINGNITRRPDIVEQYVQGVDGLTPQERAQHKEEEERRWRLVQQETVAFDREFDAYDDSYKKYEDSYNAFQKNMEAWRKATDEAQKKLDEEAAELERRRKALDDQILDDGTRLHRGRTAYGGRRTATKHRRHRPN
jgi:hypothetical protein